MRNISRITPFMMQINELWIKEFPDLRFGQLMYNFSTWLTQEGIDWFYLEEPEFLELFRDYVKRNSND